MNPTVDLSELPLRDIHLPGPVPWWPPAPGWWLLVALGLVALAAYGVHYYLQRHRRAALAAVERLRRELAHGGDAAAVLRRLSTVMRRFAMTTASHGHEIRAAEGFDPDSVPGLVGERWLAYLDSRWERDGFSRGAGRVLTAAPYVRTGAADAAAALDALALCDSWLKRQRRGWRSLLAPRARRGGLAAAMPRLLARRAAAARGD
jgi:hypothetical protein